MAKTYKITYRGGEQYGLHDEAGEFSSNLEATRYAERQARVVDPDTKNEHSLRFDVEATTAEEDPRGNS